MAANGKIGWVTHDFVPWRIRDSMRVVASETAWEKPMEWNRNSACKCGSGFRGTHSGYCPQDRRRPGVLVPVDVFEDWQGELVDANGERLYADDHGDVPITMQGVRYRLFDLIGETPNLDWLLLTKQPENVLRMTYVAWCKKVPRHVQQNEGDGRHWAWPSSVWLGTSVEDQATADERIPHLLKVPATVRFLSCEPLIGPVDLSRWVYDRSSVVRHAMRSPMAPNRDQAESLIPECGIGWIICGGESGPGARPMHPDWARSLRDQCSEAGVPFFFKQWGDWVGGEDFFSGTTEDGPSGLYAQLQNGTTVHESAFADEQWHNWNDDVVNQVNDPVSVRVGKSAAGRLLDGRTWDELPVSDQIAAGKVGAR